MIVLDSDVLVHLLKADARTMDWLEGLEAAGEELATTSVNVAEVLRGSAPASRQRAATETLLRALVEVPFGPRAARRFAGLMHECDRTGTAVPAIDGMVAAATLEAGAKLATRNVRHFRKVAGLQLLAP